MARSRELCEALGDTAALLPVISGLWTYYISKPDLKSARETAEHMLTISRNLNDPVLRVGAHGALALTLEHQGELVGSRKQFEELYRLYDIAQHGRCVQLYRYDPGLHCVGQYTRLLWLLGFPIRRAKRPKKLWLLRAGFPVL